MELTAAIRAIRILKGNRVVTVRSDSSYLVRGMSEWMDNWRSRGWRNAQGKRVENVPLWEELLAAAEPHRVTWEWLKGHAGDAMNTRVDRLAVSACRRV